MNFRIEQLTLDHLESCVEVFVAAFTKPDCFPWKPDDVRIRLQDLWNEPKRAGVVAIDGPDETNQDHALMGFAIGNFVQVADGPALRIAELCVHPTRQHYGLGSRLLLEMEEIAREGGAHSAYLTVQPDSVDFCRRLGYEQQDEWISMGRRLHSPETSTQSGDET
ncbi:MAG: GNAT family N-acetyltransferase [Thermomicrobiales bacterium]|nr:GNAT family N-acetyltransferase [Thermomicrobiales bacterium]MCO5222173.1 GNAT family N-acetyltransferase [Thermomicrobiales bacterium]